VRFGTLHTNFIASQVAGLFPLVICKLHRIPKSMHFIWLRSYYSWALFCDHFSGSTTLCYAWLLLIISKEIAKSINPFNGGKFLYWVEWHYNSSYHTSAGMSPYQTEYRKLPSSLLPHVTRSSTCGTSVNLLEAQTNIKTYADQQYMHIHFIWVT